MISPQTIKTAQAVQKMFGSNYYAATLLLPKHIRYSVFIFYAFVRLADDADHLDLRRQRIDLNGGCDVRQHLRRRSRGGLTHELELQDAAFRFDGAQRDVCPSTGRREAFDCDLGHRLLRFDQFHFDRCDGVKARE